MTVFQMEELQNYGQIVKWTSCKIMDRLSNGRAAKLWPDFQTDELQNNGQIVKWTSCKIMDSLSNKRAAKLLYGQSVK